MTEVATRCMNCKVLVLDWLRDCVHPDVPRLVGVESATLTLVVFCRRYVARGAPAQPLPPAAESRHQRHGGPAGAADRRHPAEPLLRGGQRQAAGGQPNVPALPPALCPL